MPLPDGWSAQLSEDQAFRAGPPGHPVLRIDLRPGQGAALPTAAQLATDLRSSLKRAQLTVTEQISRPDFTLVVYLLMPPSKRDAGLLAEAAGLLGAKRVEGDLFLCATTPGATEEEVDQAAKACEALTVDPVAR